jgi:hypothetical protein
MTVGKDAFRHSFLEDGSLQLVPPLADDEADDCAADCAEDENGGVGFGDDGVGEAEEEAEEEAGCPVGEGEACRADDEADGEAVEECARQGRPFVFEGEREHGGGGERAVDEAADRAEQESGHCGKLRGELKERLIKA